MAVKHWTIGGVTSVLTMVIAWQTVDWSNLIPSSNAAIAANEAVAEIKADMAVHLEDDKKQREIIKLRHEIDMKQGEWRDKWNRLQHAMEKDDQGMIAELERQMEQIDKEIADKKARLLVLETA